jgi:tetratricopeptide (TPR) repeat protein
MIRFEEPLALLLALPWLVFWAGFARLQGRACRWIWENVGERFRHRFTVYTPKGLRWQMGWLLVLGLLLAAAAARPTVPGREPVRELTGRVVLVLDASASMRASDGAPAEDGSGEGRVRFEEARELAAELVRRRPGWRFALVTFSGVATLQVPLTSDAAMLEDALRVVEIHNFYRSTGSSFVRALDRVLPFAEAEEGLLQAVLLSDGEPPFEESYEEPLAALAARGVPVHTAAFGSEEGQTRVIYDFRDVVAGKTEKRVLRELTTRRVDEHLARIAHATGGTFTVVDSVGASQAADTLAAALARGQEQAEGAPREGRRDVTAELLGLALLVFLFDALLLGRPPRGSKRSPEAFDLRRLGAARSATPPAFHGEPAAAAQAPRHRGGTLTLWIAVPAAGLLAVAGCRGEDPLRQASRQNEAGIAADASGRWTAARTHYERSLAFEELAQIPTHNLARSLTLQSRFSEAHDLYQRALELEPALAPAHYNDGWALFAWGEAERDPRGCRLERTRDLWTAARDRFADAAELYEAGSSEEGRSQRNRSFVTERLEEIEALIADPPPECAEEPPPPEAGSGGAGGGAGGGGTEGVPPQEQDQNQPGEDPEGQGSQNPRAQGSDGAPPPLSPDGSEQIARALERLAGQGREEGKFYRRTREEQFPSESWKNPEREIWW